MSMEIILQIIADGPTDLPRHKTDENLLNAETKQQHEQNYKNAPRLRQQDTEQSQN